jgi:hypothetical protein
VLKFPIVIIAYIIIYHSTEEYMSQEENYECVDCGNQAQAVAEGDPVPECCGKPMQKQEPLQACEAPAGAEHSRFDDLGEPCDDGRAGS